MSGQIDHSLYFYNAFNTSSLPSATVNANGSFKAAGMIYSSLHKDRGGADSENHGNLGIGDFRLALVAMFTGKVDDSGTNVLNVPNDTTSFVEVNLVSSDMNRGGADAVLTAGNDVLHEMIKIPWGQLVAGKYFQYLISPSDEIIKRFLRLQVKFPAHGGGTFHAYLGNPPANSPTYPTNRSFA